MRAERLEAAAKPSLRLEFDPAKNPLYDSLHLDGKLRHIRISAFNPQPAESVADVAVKLARILPQTAGVFPMQEMRLTHSDPPASRFTLNASTEPLTFIEIVSQSIDPGTGRTTQMGLDFIGGRRLLSLAVDHYLLWLEIDGSGAIGPRKFVLKRNDKTGQYDMTIAPFG
jgi:hypothetical protein